MLVVGKGDLPPPFFLIIVKRAGQATHPDREYAKLSLFPRHPLVPQPGF
jgi:hypothetical protein